MSTVDRLAIESAMGLGPGGSRRPAGFWMVTGAPQLDSVMSTLPGPCQ